MTWHKQRKSEDDAVELVISDHLYWTLVARIMSQVPLRVELSL